MKKTTSKKSGGVGKGKPETTTGSEWDSAHPDGRAFDKGVSLELEQRVRDWDHDRAEDTSHE